MLPSGCDFPPMTFRTNSLVFAAACLLALAWLPSTRAEDAFKDWPTEAAPADIGRRLTLHFLSRPYATWNQEEYITYPEVCTWYGALTYARVAGENGLTARLLARLDPIVAGPEAHRVPPMDHVDHNVFAAVPLEAYIQTKAARYRSLGLQLADGQWDHAAADGLTPQTRFWIDDMYMITAVQIQAFRATGDVRYLDRAAKEMVVYLARLQQPNGLFFHAEDVPFYWGRGNGWMAAGMTELLLSLPEDHPSYRPVLDGYRRMMATLRASQASDGMWRQLIDQPDAWPESSCTGMFTFAFVTGVKRGWLDAAEYGPAARKAWLGLVAHIDANGDVRDVCEGTNKKNDRAHYLARERRVGDMHGQAPVLWCVTAFLR